jgi:hypothetical protein
MKVLIYTNTSKQVGDIDHLKVFAYPIQNNIIESRFML